MEKENKRLRDDAIREFNDAVRSLVSFVRKRDPRYTANSQSEADRQKILRDAAAAQAARSRAAHQAKIDAHVVPDWARSPAQDDQTGSFSDSELSDEEQFECVVCGKTFKSEKQYEAHERSKKHVKAVQQLKRQMRKENKHLNLDGDSDDGLATPESTADGQEEVVETDEKLSQVNDTPESADVVPTGLGAEKDADHDAEENVPDEESSESDLDDEYASRAAVEGRLVNDPMNNNIIAGVATVSLENSGDENNSSSGPKLGKAKAKRAKKAAKQEAAAGAAQRCGVCNEEFPSKTKLFAHLKSEGHEAPPSQTASGGGGKKKAKRK